MPPLSVQDKTHFRAGGRVPRATLLPANTRFLKSHCGTLVRVRDARTLTSLPASGPFTARDGLTTAAASRERNPNTVVAWISKCGR